MAIDAGMQDLFQIIVLKYVIFGFCDVSSAHLCVDVTKRMPQSGDGLTERGVIEEGEGGGGGQQGGARASLQPNRYRKSVAKSPHTDQKVKYLITG